MSTTATIPPAGGTGGRGAVGAYVDDVRAHLDDLAPDEIEELTGGLEADLTDALAGTTTTPDAQFGTPAAYAAELRAAAGLAPRAAGGDRRAERGLGAIVATQWAHQTGRLRQQSWWPELSAQVTSLRPAWWVLRGYVAAQVIARSFGMPMSPTRYWPHHSDSLKWWVMLTVLVIASMMLGRRTRSRPHGIARTLLAVANTAAVIALAGLVLVARPNPYSYVVSPAQEEPPATGLYNNGYQVVNVFPYDKDGKPLTGVQLFDDRGRPLASASTSYQDQNFSTINLIPAVDANGQQLYNVYPLRERNMGGGTDQQTGQPIERPAGGPQAADLPNPTVPALLPLTGPSPAAPAPAASATPAPTSTAPIPTASPAR